MTARIFTLPEEIIKKEVRVINEGKLAEIAYVNQRPIYLQDGRHYSWDAEGTKPVNDYQAFDTQSFFQISISPSQAWRL